LKQESFSLDSRQTTTNESGDFPVWTGAEQLNLIFSPGRLKGGGDLQFLSFEAYRLGQETKHLGTKPDAEVARLIGPG
jgi:hypothetical protein